MSKIKTYAAFKMFYFSTIDVIFHYLGWFLEKLSNLYMLPIGGMYIYVFDVLWNWLDSEDQK